LNRRLKIICYMYADTMVDMQITRCGKLTSARADEDTKNSV
jgi:hypothetical protein